MYVYTCSVWWTFRLVDLRASELPSDAGQCPVCPLFSCCSRCG